MLESYCRSEVWKKCQEVAGTPPIVYLKGEPRKRWEFEHFFRGSSAYNIVWDYSRKRSNDITFRYAVGLFARNGEQIAQKWIDEVYGGNWKKAMRWNMNFENFFRNFERYFAKRRQAFMESTQEIIRMFRPDLKNIKQMKTNSHGGVANLLKVLTKTMNEQGSSITSIAKMQYLVCTQAGIYLPDEFITDVLVVMDEIADEKDVKSK